MSLRRSLPTLLQLQQQYNYCRSIVSRHEAPSLHIVHLNQLEEQGSFNLLLLYAPGYAIETIV